MKTLIVILATLTIAGCSRQTNKITYPMTKKVDTIDTYFGHKVPDPYRWLEDDMSEETAEWVKEQNKTTFQYLEQIPFRNKVKDRLTNIWNYPKVTAPFKEGGKWFVFKNNGLQNQSVLYIKESLNGNDKEILNPNKLSEDGTIALSKISVSKDGNSLAYSIARGGSDWNEIFIKNIDSDSLLSDHIKWVKFSNISWFEDGFFYSKYPTPKDGDKLKGENINCKIFYHKIGTSQSDDKLIYEDTKNPEWGFSTDITHDNKFLVISVTESTSGNAIYIKDLENNGEIVKVIETFDKDYHIVDHINNKLYFATNKNAPKYKIIAIDPTSLTEDDIISENKGVLEGIKHVGNKLITTYIEDAHSKVTIYSTTGIFENEIEMPIMGTTSGFSGTPDDTFTFYTITSFTTPSLIYKYDILKNKSEFYQKSQLDFDSDKYETKQVFYSSKDGTKIPMFITLKKGIELNGENPVLLYGYGGFNISLTPSFSLTRLLWLEQGGIYAVMNLRGGGEYGEVWHKAGTKMNKQNVFDDCIAAAEYLIKEKYTSEKKIALMGGSNGGLLVGAVVNQRPELFGSAFPLVGVMDMLRYHNFTIGRYWATDYGTSEESEEMFKYLIKYSPVHTINENTEYPPILVTTGDHDDRVVPAHSFKYIATMQKKYKGNNPTLIRIETNAGHGAGKPTEKVIEEYSDVFAFMMYTMGITPKY